MDVEATSAAGSEPRVRRGGFGHEALFYRSTEEFVARCASFAHGGIEAGEPVCIMLPPQRLEPLRAELGSDAARVRWEDMSVVGRNPARIIGAWREFVDCEGGPDQRVRGIGEPAYAGRSDEELTECIHHETLLNAAFGRADPLSLLCPYDATELPAAVLEGAVAAHPFVRPGETGPVRDRVGRDGLAKVLHDPLPWPSRGCKELQFDGACLHDVRAQTKRHAAICGLDGQRANELVLAVNELATNSVRHGGGGGVLRMWREPGVAVCEVSDGGHITDALAGRVCPSVHGSGGRGLWMANQLSDLVQVRSSEAGTTVRVQMKLDRS